MNLNLTKLNLESRMGKGKGSIYENAIFLKPGMILYEFDNFPISQKIKLFKYLKKKIFAKIIYIYKYNN
ncbi:ribosomal protein L16 [Bacillus mycoides]|uniref:ribosomal protein L16 n=1 Tax=Bacillus mycoides TaxID=1405 RepID=UPI003D646C53